MTLTNRHEWLHILAILIACMTLGACAGPQAVGEDKMDLDQSLKTFHKNLRWSRYEIASEQLTPSYKQRFLGRYEEMGEDMHFVHLEVLKIDRDDDVEATVANVEVLQKWYREPDMTVKNDKIIEIWRRESSGWQLSDRVEKTEWRERERAKKDAKIDAETGDDEGADAPPPAE